MKVEIRQVKDRTNEIVQSIFLETLIGQLGDHIAFVEKIALTTKENLKKLISLHEKNEVQRSEIISFLKHIRFHKQQIFELVETYLSITTPLDFDQDFHKYSKALNEFIDSLEVEKSDKQLPQRFDATPEDLVLLRIGKSFKRIFFNISQWPINIHNFFLKLFKKPLRPAKDWYHTIPFQRLTNFYYREELSQELIVILSGHKKLLSKTLVKVFRLDSSIDISTIALTSAQKDETNSLTPGSLEDLEIELAGLYELIENFKQGLPEQLATITENIFNRYEDAHEKVGTIELSGRKFREGVINKKHKQLNNAYLKSANGWKNTFFALKDEWELHLELYITYYKNVEQLFQLKQEFEVKITKNILPKLDQLTELLHTSHKTIEKFTGNDPELNDLIQNEQKNTCHKLTSQSCDQTTDVILQQDFPSSVGAFELGIRENVNNLSSKRAIVKTEEFDKEIRSSEIKYVTPYELINFEYFPTFLKVSQKVKKSIVEDLESSQESIRNLTQIVRFNLDSALDILNKEGNENKQASSIALEGLQRAIGKNNETRERIININVIVQDNLKPAIEKLNNGLIELTNTESAFDIEFRVAKARAIEQTVAFRTKIFNFFKNFVPKVIQFAKDQIQSGSNWYDKTLKQYGLTTKPTSISTEISDYLAETKTVIDGLPYVYKRLFNQTALSERNFFEGHESEILKIHNAYNNWQQNRYAPTAIIGEKGSGKSTLINLFLNDLERNFVIVNYQCPLKLYHEDYFMEFLRDIFKNDTLQSIDDAVELIRNQERKQVIIIENLQHMYLKRVEGFICLKMFFELMAKTNHSVFWLVSITQYSWDYLKDTINIPDYFGYLIPVQELGDNQIIDLISRRHQVSGYNLFFEGAQSDVHSKTYKKIENNEGKQLYLKKKYFSCLNGFAKSNISLALLFWLRSVKAIQDDLITIGSLSEIDFSFLNSLPTTKIFALHTLILHDGLTEEQYAEVANQSLAQARLMLLSLFEDGILVRMDNEMYVVNTLLYRQVVVMLKSKNLIY
ncbi:ATP-binding protein [Fulvivirgaceae bacterium BMA10]|uniref:ATP-binding protein n=1 Tax=Splendidivirga corallicola TaxID=3051826 RepID=A0ABT8KT28_9BACT|nr:ATP-binding protein [Fulvivirgaceae bacterium BMA10]